MTRFTTSLLVGSAAFLLSTANLNAGILWYTTDLPNGYAVENTAHDGINITAPASQVGLFNVFVKVDSDPRFNVWASVANDTSTPWDSYSVSITPIQDCTIDNIVALSAPPGFTDYLPTHTYNPATYTITFSGGIVPVGAALQVVYYFDITTGNSPQFATATSFHAVSAGSDIPEPASLSLLAIGAPLFLRRRRR